MCYYVASSPNFPQIFFLGSTFLRALNCSCLFIIITHLYCICRYKSVVGIILEAGGRSTTSCRSAHAGAFRLPLNICLFKRCNSSNRRQMASLLHEHVTVVLQEMIMNITVKCLFASFYRTLICNL